MVDALDLKFSSFKSIGSSPIAGIFFSQIKLSKLILFFMKDCNFNCVSLNDLRERERGDEGGRECGFI